MYASKALIFRFSLSGLETNPKTKNAFAISIANAFFCCILDDYHENMKSLKYKTYYLED